MHAFPVQGLVLHYEAISSVVNVNTDQHCLGDNGLTTLTVALKKGLPLKFV